MKDSINTLIQLGLSLTQAKTYLTLVKSGTQTIKGIAINSKIPRTDLYSILEKLENRGLIEKIVETPIKYKAIPIKEALSLLLQERNTITLEIQNKMESLEKKIGNSGENYEDGKPKFMMFSNKRIISKITENIERAEISVDLIVSTKRLEQGLFHFEDILKKSFSKKVKWRILIHTTKTKIVPNNSIKIGINNPFCKVKAISFPAAIISIYDHKQVIFVDNPKNDLNDSPCLWTDNKNMINIMEHYFNSLWNQSNHVLCLADFE